ncbi:probable G-protein coupled receptor 139 [Rhincodon typus]|uniref:probable G-protein coupled receptor 139 n=1 Tax=Rhincodon typus TaxID=259920 RepID=UPI00202F192A|nr:probable G-protein coupled receptor 139 [Rhincodon typus]
MEDTNNMPIIDNKEAMADENLETIIFMKEVILGKLMGLNADNPPGPDGMYPRALKEMAGEITNAPMITRWVDEEIDEAEVDFGKAFVNVLAIVILSQRACGLSKCITQYLIAMATADFLVVIADVMLRWLILYFPVSFLDITHVCSFVMVLIPATTIHSIWMTVAFTIDRFVAICCPKLKTKYCTEKTASVIIGTASVLSYLECIPWFFKFKSKYIFNNLQWFCITKPEYYTSIFWAVYEIFHRLLAPLLPFVIILLLNTLTVRHILVASKARRRLQKDSDRERSSDPEMDKRRKSIILLFAISGSFIILWTPYVVCFLYQRISLMYDYSSLSPTAGTIGYMLQLLSTCTNTCIYTVTQSQFREQLKAVVKIPFTLILRSIKQ